MSSPAPPSTDAASAPRPWIPIRSLAASHREAIYKHLTVLNERDRYLRFGYPASDEQIRRYVDGLDFDRDEVFGVFNRRLDIVALAHVAYPEADLAGSQPAEFGGSVLPRLRGYRFGTRLFEHAMLHARNRGIDALFIHALSENTAMLAIARRAGATVERSGGESDATLRLPQRTIASHAEALVGEGAAAIDYRIKQQSLLVDTLIDAIGDVKAGIDGTGHTGSS